MLVILRLLTSVVDTSEWYLKRKLASLGFTESQGLMLNITEQREELLRNYLQLNPGVSKEEIDRFEKNLETYLQEYHGADYVKAQSYDYGKEVEFQRRFEQINKLNKARKYTQPGPFKKYRSLEENIRELEKMFRSSFGKAYNEIFKLFTGMSFTELMGFVNRLKFYKYFLYCLDPVKITKDLLRSIAVGINDIFAELSEITGADTLELSDNTEVTTLSSSWLTHGWFMREGAGANMVSYGTLHVWDKNGRLYTITNCPENVWAQMKRAQGEGGHWYAPVGAGSWLHFFIKMGVVSIW